MRVESWLGVTMVMLTLFGGVIAAEPQQCRRSNLPANVVVPRYMEEVIERIYERSPRFRTQIAQIASADNLRVVVRIDPAIPHYCRAFTVISRRGHLIRAEMHLPPSADHAELLAHEFEHVIEQIEGLDLETLSRVTGSGVHDVAEKMFETDRAQAAGLLVAAEVGSANRRQALR